MASEAQIRDALAENLELIEAGFTVVQKEFHLPNLTGTRGYIDILARDKFGHLVVIEIKKSNKAAREAIHELFKYVALLKVNHKLSNDRVRCILLSTEWRELLVPFSEFAREAHYHVEGFQILLDKEGLPSSLEPVILVPEGESLTFCPHHMIYLYSTEERRTDAEPLLEETLNRLGINYVVVSLDYKGNNTAVIFPFAHYLVITAITPESRGRIEEKYQISVSTDFEEEEEPTQWEFEDEVLGFIGKDTFSLRDDTEIGYPEKFAGVLKNWVIKDIKSKGKGLDSREINNNDFIVAQIMGLHGENAAVYHVVSSPRFRPKWKTSKEGVNYSLIGNNNWGKGVTAYLDELGKQDKEANVSILVYNPCNTILSLYKLGKNEYEYLPILEIAVEPSRGNRVKVLWGCLMWDGKTLPQSPETVIKDVFGDPNNFFISIHFGETYKYEEAVVRKHGLRYELFEFIIDGQKPQSVTRAKVKAGKIIRAKVSKNEGYDLLKFAEENKGYILKLFTFIESNISGF